MDKYKDNETVTVTLERWDELQNGLAGWKNKCEAIQQILDERSDKLDSALIVIRKIVADGNDAAIAHFLIHGPNSVDLVHFSQGGPEVRKPYIKIKQQ